MTRRRGVTLVEVLVAIMITGVGLLALLTLFPLGMLEMAQSIKDDRCGHIKHNGAAIASAWDFRNDPLLRQAMLNPEAILVPPPGNLPTLDPTQPQQKDSASYPVFVDVNGWWANNNAGTPAALQWRDWMAGQTDTVPRRVPFTLLSTTSPDANYVTPPAADPGYPKRQRLLWTTFLDDMTFPRDDPNGVPVGRPCVPPNGVVDRSPVYSWCCVCRMPRISAPSVVELTVVVYRGRALDASTTGENAFAAQFNPGSNVVTLTWGAGQTAPDVVNGTWIFDATMKPKPQGYFYRVISVTQTGPNSMDVEVQTPLRGTGAGTVIILDNVVEVFERGIF